MQADQATFKSYLLFWAGQIASLLGSSIAQFVIVWWITLETGSTLFLSIAAFLGYVPMIILAPFAGVLADRWNRRVLIAVVDFLQALATIVLISLFWTGIVSVWYVLTLLTFRGIFQAFHSPTVAAIIPAMVPKDKLSRINGLNYLFTGVVNLSGPVIAAVLLGFWAISQILWIDALTFIVALIPLLMIRIPSVRDKGQKTSFREDLVAGWGFIRSARGLLAIIISAIGINFLITPLSTLFPYYVKFDHFGEAADLAFVEAIFGVGTLVGGLFMSVKKDFKKKIPLILSLLLVLNVGYALVAFTPTGLFWFMGVGGLIMAVTIPIVDVLAVTVIQTVVPLEMQGRVMSVIVSLGHAATPVGMIFAGGAAALTGTANLFLMCAGLGALMPAISWFFTDIRHIGEMEEPSVHLQTHPTPQTLQPNGT